MTVIQCFDAIRERLTTDPVVRAFEIVRERVTLVDGHLRARLTLSDKPTLEFSEYVQQSASNQIDVVTYSYHWAQANGELIRRWDNTPHFPNLEASPHHVHDGRAGSVTPGAALSIFRVLDEIVERVS